MVESENDPTPPEGLPQELVAALEGASNEERRNAIIYAQELLYAEEDSNPPVEARPGEDVLEITEHDGFTKVVKRIPCGDDCEDCPHGPYVYHVTEEPRPEGGTHTHWKFIGPVDETGL